MSARDKTFQITPLRSAGDFRDGTLRTREKDPMKLAERIRLLFEAGESKNADAFVSHFTPGAHYRFGNAPAGVGRAQMKRSVEDFVASVGTFWHEVYTSSQGREDGAHIEMQVHSTMPDGVVITLPCADVFRFVDDDIADMDVTPVAMQRQVRTVRFNSGAGVLVQGETPVALDFNAFEQSRAEVGNGVHIAYRRAGSGPPPVLLHGWPQHSLMWNAVAPRLAEHFTVVVPDLRGAGASTIARNGYDKATMARDIHNLTTALELGPICLAGYDLGAGVACAFARQFRNDVRRLAVMEFASPGSASNSKWCRNRNGRWLQIGTSRCFQCRKPRNGMPRQRARTAVLDFLASVVRRRPSKYSAF